MPNENCTDRDRWDTVVRRNRGHDDEFVFGVLTTGVYCRPSCPARRGLCANVHFFESPIGVERAGLRACRRCQPNGPESDPVAYAMGGKGLNISYACIDTPLGHVMIGATDRGLCFVQFGDVVNDLLALLEAEYPAAGISPMKQPYPEQFGHWIEALDDHLRWGKPLASLPTDVGGTAFQQSVWRFLQSIPAGEVRTYSQVAEGIGRPKAIRATATACAANRVAVVIPCHRVVRAQGESGNYRWGVERKRELLARERVAVG